MSCPQWEERLSDFVDGSSGPADTLAVEQHLSDCTGCRAEADDLRSVLRLAASLPRRIEPGRDLWPGVAADLRRPIAGRLWPGATAAALILAAATVTSMLWNTGPRGKTETAAAAVAVSRDMDENVALKEAQEEFQKATAKLMAVLERRKADLPPQTIAELEKDLRVVNDAIAETTAALARDPENHRLGVLLTDIYATKLDLLSKAVRVPGAA